MLSMSGRNMDESIVSGRELPPTDCSFSSDGRSVGTERAEGRFLLVGRNRERKETAFLLGIKISFDYSVSELSGQRLVLGSRAVH